VVVVVVVEVLVVEVLVVDVVEDVVEVLADDVDVVEAIVVAGGSIVVTTTVVVRASVDSRPSPWTADVHAGSIRTDIVRSTIARRSTTLPDGSAATAPRHGTAGVCLRSTSMPSDTCTHLDTIADVEPSSHGCEECLRMGGQWVHLRMCQTCGHIGCCDNSPNRHATAHWREHQDHPLIRSFEPGEDWWWCYADELFFEIEDAPPSPSHH
jgi:hypothetical protein